MALSWRLKLIALLLFGVSVCGARAEDGDWQLWTEYQYSQTVGYGLDLGVRWEPHFEEDISTLAYYELEPFINWRYSPRWDFMLSYERDERIEAPFRDDVADPPMDDEVMEEPETGVDNLATAAATLKIPLRDWFVTNRFRMEFVVPESDNMDWRAVYRNRTGIATTWKFGSKELIPFISEEWFYNIQDGEFVQNRLQIGLGMPVVPHWITSVYFMRLDQRTPQGWEWHPVVGVQVMSQF